VLASLQLKQGSTLRLPGSRRASRCATGACMSPRTTPSQPGTSP